VAVSGSDIKETALVFGGTNELDSAVKKFCAKSNPELIFVLSSSVPEIRGEVYETFLETSAKLGFKAIIVQTPDFQGGFSEGFSKLVYAAIDQLAQGGGLIQNQINILPAPYMTAGDIDEIREIVESFNFNPVFIPDISLGADGSKEKFSAMAVDGTTVSQIETSGRSAATISFGSSMKPAGDLLLSKFGVNHVHMDAFYGLSKTDVFIAHLIKLAGTQPGIKVAHRLKKNRARLKDIMIDTHLMLTNKTAAIALEYDQAYAYGYLLNELGVHTGTIFSPVVPPGNSSAEIQEGTLYDIELSILSGEDVDVLVSNTHGKELSTKFNIPLIRTGFPVTDIYGFNYRTSVGYKGAIEVISELANKIKEGHHDNTSGEVIV